MRLIGIFILSLLTLNQALAGVTERLGVEKLDSWSEEFTEKLYEDIGDEWDDAGEKVSASIFKSITDRKLIDFDIAGGNLSFRIKRRAYDNFSINNSWTVVDTFRLPLTIPLYTSGALPLGPANVGVRLSTTVGLDAVNIRQVQADTLDIVPDLDFLNSSVKESLNSLPEYLISTKTNSQDFLEEQDYIHVLDENEEDDKFIDAFKFWETENPQAIARYTSLLNLLTHPLRLPVTKKAVMKMPVTEISSYSLDGAISLGGHAGWGIQDLSVGAGITTYLVGSFKISVYKESERYVQVKLTRRKTKGVGASFGSTHSDFVVFKGFVVMDKTILDVKDSVIPFNMSLDRPTSKTFDVGYRFDLENKDALDAYGKAVFGRFADAEKLSENSDGVVKLFTRDENSTSRNSRYRMKLAFFFENESGSSKKFVTANIKLPDGRHKIFKAISSNATGYDTLWNMSESRNYVFKTEVDNDAYNSTDDQGLALTIEAKIKDSHTSGKELNRYIEEIEEATGQHKLFPRVPEKAPRVEEDLFGMPPAYSSNGRQVRPTNSDKYYRKSSFFYKIGFTRSQIEKFRDVPSKEKWAILEKAFDVKEGAWSSWMKRTWFQAKYSLVTLVNVPLAIANLHIKEGSKLIMALKFHSNWEELAETDSGEELVRVTAELFASSNFSVEFIKVLKLVVEGEEISYFINASNHSSFGNIIKRGSELAAVDRITHSANITINFDHTGPRPVDPAAEISLHNFKVTTIDRETVEIEFKLTNIPEYVFIRLDRTDSWKSFKNYKKMIVANKGDNRELFKIGLNKWTISKDDVDGVFGHLSQGLFEKNQNSFKTIQIAVSANQNDWSPLSAHRFKLPRK